MRKALLLALLLVPVALLHGQDTYRFAKIVVPFDFYAHGILMPAGHYSFGINVHRSALIVRNTTTRSLSTFVPVQQFQGKEILVTETIVSFERIGNRHFFRGLALAGFGRAISPPDIMQRNLQKLAKEKVDLKPEEVGK